MKHHRGQPTLAMEAVERMSGPTEESNRSETFHPVTENGHIGQGRGMVSMDFILSRTAEEEVCPFRSNFQSTCPIIHVR